MFSVHPLPPYYPPPPPTSSSLLLQPTQAEIEHFVNPDDKSHPKFGAVAGLEPLLYRLVGRVLGLCVGVGCFVGWCSVFVGVFLCLCCVFFICVIVPFFVGGGGVFFAVALSR